MNKSERYDRTVTLQKFSESLTSPVVTIRGIRAHLSKTFQGAFKESAEQECILSEEDRRIFGYFVEYMYREGWLHDAKSSLHQSKLSTLARLYTMGDRLMVKGLQDLALRKIAVTLDKTRDLPDQEEVCDFLEVAGAEVPDTPNDDALQAQVLWYAASRLHKLQNFNRFHELLRQYPQLAVKLCMLAGNGNTTQPKIPSISDDKRFKPESIYS
ncbi:hypothetical protein EPUS_08334 [Endocarpon pusillum Z07020]|uniref:BTB domain-containing protein n=1 Tax=Endocarpon pusillum (strain Z07020 / HMAS-L-300199) TaxID=1263415 RepID=U1GG79_ENDPU|nr:uncharacterized protein EPUS_08334 [Endocarpon pusillum Z07020]ERF70776.1 hypothetical protein EPUS_08334 [Endocarpon pusillum Z07020]